MQTRSSVRGWSNGGRLRRWPSLVVVAAVLAVTGHALAQADGGSVAVEGMWVSPGVVASLPVSGVAWETVSGVAASFDASMTDYGWQDSVDGTRALAAALVFARTGDEGLRAEVASAIESIADGGYVTNRNPSALGWARTMTSWVVASDLIDLSVYRPDVDVRWREFLAGMPTFPYSGDGGGSLYELAVRRANNIGAVARTAVTAIAVYVGDDALVSEMAGLYRAWVEGSSVYRFDWDVARDRSWQCVPGDPSSYRGINPAGCVRDGHDLGGVLPEEFRRSGSYDAADFPGDNLTKYPWEALGAAVVQAELLVRAGFPDALEWGDRAPLRALERLEYLHEVAADRGWTFGRAAGGGSDDRWIIHLVNGLYGTGFPEPAETWHGRPLSWTDWTHAEPTTAPVETATTVMGTVVSATTTAPVTSTTVLGTVLWSASTGSVTTTTDPTTSSTSSSTTTSTTTTTSTSSTTTSTTTTTVSSGDTTGTKGRGGSAKSDCGTGRSKRCATP